MDIDNLLSPAFMRKLLGGMRLSETAKEALAFYEGDHWQGGKAWVGPRVDADNSSKVMNEIKRGLVSQNVIAEIVERHIGGVMGKEPSWRFSLVRSLEEGESATESELGFINETEAALTVWWNKRKIAKLLKEALVSLLCVGRVVLRVVIPPTKLEEGDELPKTTELSEALDMIYLDIPDLSNALVVEPKETMEPIGIYRYYDEQRAWTELTFVNEEGQTVLRITPLNLKEGETGQEIIADLGGNLWHYQLERDPIITPQICEMQKLVNMALSMMARNVVLAGFLERVFFNVQPPGKVTTDPVTGASTWEPEPFYVGAGTINVLQGIQVIDETTGQTRIANPSVSYNNPVPVTTFNDTKNAAYKGILSEANQAHALIAGDATASGESRIQARADYLNDLRLTEPEVASATEWVLATVLSIAGAIMGNSIQFQPIRPVVTVRVNSGPLSPDEARLVSEQVESGLMSQEMARGLIGIDDTKSEAQKVAEEKRGNIERQIQMTELAVGLADIADFPDEILETAGFVKTEIEALREASMKAAELGLELNKEVPEDGEEDTPADEEEEDA